MSYRPPHLDRLLARLDSLAAPIVQVWGWQGSGRSALAKAVFEREGENARGLSAADLGRPQQLAAALDGDHRWLIAHVLPSKVDPAPLLANVAERLAPGRRLLFVTSRLVSTDGPPWAMIGPIDLLLRQAEVVELWRNIAGQALEPDEAATLARTSEGWFRPICLAAESATDGRGVPTSATELAALPAVAGFLRHEAINGLDTAERRVLDSLGRGTEFDPRTLKSRWHDSPQENDALHRLLEVHGWFLGAEDGRLRLPAPLDAFLGRNTSHDPLPIVGDSTENSTDSKERGSVQSIAAIRTSSAVDRQVGSAGVDGTDLRTVGESQARNRVDLFLLGRPRAVGHIDGSESTTLHWPLKRAFRLLMYLASSPELSASKSELIADLFPGEDERKIRRNFHPTLSHLRRGLRGFARDDQGSEVDPVLLKDGVYSLNPEVHWSIDLAHFHGHDRSGDRRLEAGDRDAARAAWEVAWKTYRGDLVDGNRDPWVIRRRETVQRRYLDLLLKLGDLYVDLDQVGAAIDAYRAILVTDALSERIHVALMGLYAREGRRDLVRTQYDRLTDLLRRDLGVEPLPQTTEEYHRLMIEPR